MVDYESYRNHATGWRWLQSLNLTVIDRGDQSSRNSRLTQNFVFETRVKFSSLYQFKLDRSSLSMKKVWVIKYDSWSDSFGASEGLISCVSPCWFMQIIKHESYYGMFRARAPGMIFRLIWCAEIELLIYLNLFIYNNYLRSRSWNNGSIMPSARNINIVVFCVTWCDGCLLKAYSIVYIRTALDYEPPWTICPWMVPV